MRTTAPSESIRQLIEGRHENPFELLGPHLVDDSGRRALAVRAFLPQSAQAWVVDPGQRGRPAHAADPSRRTVRGPLSGPRGQREVALRAPRGRRRGKEDDHARSLLLSAPADRLRSAPVERRPALAVLQPAGGAAPHHRRRRGGELRRLGPQRHQRQRGRRLQRLGRPPPPHAQAHPQRLLGIVRPRAERRHALQIPDPPRRLDLREVRSLRLRRRGAAADRLEGDRSEPLSLARRGLGGRAALDQLAGAAAFVLRGPPGQLAAARRRSRAAG